MTAPPRSERTGKPLAHRAGSVGTRAALYPPPGRKPRTAMNANHEARV